MYYSPERRAIIYSAATLPPENWPYLPWHAPLGAHVVVRADMPTVQTLRVLNLPVPSLMERDYDWPIRPGLTPMRHQRLMAPFMASHPRCFNLSGMRTGKTLTTLWAADYLMGLGMIRRALITAKLTTLQRVWVDHILSHFLGRRTCAVVYGDRQRRLTELARDVDFYIINHDGLGIGSKMKNRALHLGALASAVAERADIDCLIVDEGSAFKEGTATRTRILRQVAQNKPYVWWLTGTPTPNEPTDAWSQARAVRKDYADSQKNFKDR